MDLHSMIIRWGVPTYFTSLVTDIPTDGKPTFPIGKILPEQIGRIYGLSIYADTVDAQNIPLITTADAQVLYLQFKWGSSDFIDQIRLDDMLYNFVGVPNVNPSRYLPVNIPKDFNLDKTNYFNPTKLITGRILLNLWYISDATYNELLETKQVLINAAPKKGGKK